MLLPPKLHPPMLWALTFIFVIDWIKSIAYFKIRSNEIVNYKMLLLPILLGSITSYTHTSYTHTNTCIWRHFCFVAKHCAVWQFLNACVEKKQSSVNFINQSLSSQCVDYFVWIYHVIIVIFWISCLLSSTESWLWLGPDFLCWMCFSLCWFLYFRYSP